MPRSRCNESNALLILDADTGATITNISVGNPAHAVAWDNVGNAYIAFDVTGTESPLASLVAARSQPGNDRSSGDHSCTRPLPQITSISRSGNNVTIQFTGPATDPASAYVLLSGAVVSGITNNSGATITGSGGAYQATLTTNAAAQFYRVQRP